MKKQTNTEKLHAALTTYFAAFNLKEAMIERDNGGVHDLLRRDTTLDNPTVTQEDPYVIIHCNRGKAPNLYYNLAEHLEEDFGLAIDKKMSKDLFAKAPQWTLALNSDQVNLPTILEKIKAATEALQSLKAEKAQTALTAFLKTYDFKKRTLASYSKPAAEHLKGEDGGSVGDITREGHDVIVHWNIGKYENLFNDMQAQLEKFGYNIIRVRDFIPAPALRLMISADRPHSDKAIAKTENAVGRFADQEAIKAAKSVGTHASKHTKRDILKPDDKGWAKGAK